MGAGPSAQLPVGVEEIAGYTYMGNSVWKCCAAAEFQPGVPSECCGAVCGLRQADVPADCAKALSQLEAELPSASAIATDAIDRDCYIYCNRCDTSVVTAAARVNEEWCKPLNARFLDALGLRAFALDEIHGFGRSRRTLLIIHVVRKPEGATAGGYGATP